MTHSPLLPAAGAHDVPPELLTLLSTLKAELHHPGRACTRERLEQLLHPAFHEIGRSGLPYDRDHVIASQSRPQPRTPGRAYGHRAQWLGPGWALLTFRSWLTGDDGAPRHAAQRSSVWAQTDLGWQLVYHQGTPDPHPDADPSPSLGG